MSEDQTPTESQPEPNELTPVDFFSGDMLETLNYRTCDFCYESACEDIWAGKLGESEWRKFFLLPCQTCICSNCVEKGLHLDTEGAKSCSS